MRRIPGFTTENSQNYSNENLQKEALEVAVNEKINEVECRNNQMEGKMLEVQFEM